MIDPGSGSSGQQLTGAGQFASWPDRMHKRRPRSRLASKYHRALAHWDARPMARDWPQDRWFQVGGVRGSQPGRPFWGWGTAGGPLGTDTPGEGWLVSVLTAIFGEDAGVFCYRVSILHRSTRRLQVLLVGFPIAEARNELKF